MDGEESRRVTVDSRYYDHLEHGYAATVHKSQGTTVDRTYVLATPHFDRHSTYVALSRHREAAAVFYGREDFEPQWSRASAQENLRNVLSRARPKELAHDYLDRGPAGESRSRIPSGPSIEQETTTLSAPSTLTALDRLRQRADQVARRLAAEREQERSAEALEQRRVRERHHDQTLGREKAKERGLAQEHDAGLEL
jgi:hypothetical protein